MIATDHGNHVPALGDVTFDQVKEAGFYHAIPASAQLPRDARTIALISNSLGFSSVDQKRFENHGFQTKQY